MSFSNNETPIVCGLPLPQHLFSVWSFVTVMSTWAGLEACVNKSHIWISALPLPCVWWLVFWEGNLAVQTFPGKGRKKLPCFMIFKVKARAHLKWRYNDDRSVSFSSARAVPFYGFTVWVVKLLPGPCISAVYKPDRAWQPIPQPGAGVSMGQHAAAPRPWPRRVPRSRHLPHKARFWSRRYARYCIFLDRGLCRLSADICFHSQRGWLQVSPR